MNQLKEIICQNLQHLEVSGLCGSLAQQAHNRLGLQYQLILSQFLKQMIEIRIRNTFSISNHHNFTSCSMPKQQHPKVPNTSYNVPQFYGNDMIPLYCSFAYPIPYQIQIPHYLVPTQPAQFQPTIYQTSQITPTNKINTLNRTIYVYNPVKNNTLVRYTPILSEQERHNPVTNKTFKVITKVSTSPVLFTNTTHVQRHVQNSTFPGYPAIRNKPRMFHSNNNTRVEFYESTSDSATGINEFGSKSMSDVLETRSGSIDFDPDSTEKAPHVVNHIVTRTTTSRPTKTTTHFTTANPPKTRVATFHFNNNSQVEFYEPLEAPLQIHETFRTQVIGRNNNMPPNNSSEKSSTGTTPSTARRSIKTATAAAAAKATHTTTSSPKTTTTYNFNNTQVEFYEPSPITFKNLTFLPLHSNRSDFKENSNKLRTKIATVTKFIPSLEDYSDNLTTTAKVTRSTDPSYALSTTTRYHFNSSKVEFYESPSVSNKAATPKVRATTTTYSNADSEEIIKSDTEQYIKSEANSNVNSCLLLPILFYFGKLFFDAT